MAYAILRFSKQKGGSAGRIDTHHERRKEKYRSNPDIDSSRTHRNYHLKKPGSAYRFEIDRRIKAAGCRVRKDSIKFVDTFVGISPEFAKAHPKEMKEYFAHAYQFLCERVGESNIFSAVVHMDEATPHMHLCFVPLTPDRRLSAKEILGDRVKMVQWQDDFHAHMQKTWPELERGRPALETKRKHIPVQLFKQAKKLDKQMEQVTALLEDTNVFNISKQREKVLTEVKQLLYYGDGFCKQVNRIVKNNKSLAKTNKAIKEDAAAAKSELFHNQFDIAKLESKLHNYEQILQQIPPDVLQKLRSQPTQKQSYDITR